MEKGWDPLRGGLVAAAVVIGLVALAVFGTRAWLTGGVANPAEDEGGRIVTAVSFDRCEMNDDSTLSIDLSYDNSENDPYLYLEVSVTDGSSTINETSFVFEDMQPGATETATMTLAVDGAVAADAPVRCELSFWSTTP